MKNNLAGFTSRIKTIGIPTASHYYVEFYMKSGDIVGAMCDSINLPGFSIASSQIITFGEFLEMPYNIMYSPISLSVIMDNTTLTRTYFDDWANTVYDRGTRTLGFYDDYVKDFRIVLLDKKSKPIYVVKVVEAWPKTINDVQLDYASHDVVKTNVTLQYKYWIREKPEEVPSLQTRISKMRNMKTSNKTLDETAVNGILAGAGRGTQGVILGKDLYGNNTPATLSPELIKLGTDLSTMGTNSDAVARALNGTSMQGASSLGSSFTKFASDFSGLGEGFSDLGKSLGAITAPVGKIATAVGSVSNTLGAIDSTLSTLGIKTNIGKIRTSLNSVSSTISAAGGLKGLPQSIGSIGANMTALGSTFTSVSDSIKTVPGATTAVSNSLNKIGKAMTRQGDAVNNAANSIEASN